MTVPTFQPDEVLRVLTNAQVDFVVVGGLAAIAHGCSQSTRDFDAVVPLTVENCRRILTALSPYEPRFYQSIGKPRVDREAGQLGTTLGMVDLLGSLPPHRRLRNGRVSRSRRQALRRHLPLRVHR